MEAPGIGNKGGAGGGRYGVQGLWEISNNGIISQIPRGGDISLGQQLANSEVQYLEGPEEVSPAIPYFGLGGRE